MPRPEDRAGRSRGINPLLQFSDRSKRTSTHLSHLSFLFELEPGSGGFQPPSVASRALANATLPPNPPGN